MRLGSQNQQAYTNPLDSDHHLPVHIKKIHLDRSHLGTAKHASYLCATCKGLHKWETRMVLQIKWPWDGLGRLCDQAWDIELGLNIKHYKISVICFEFAETKLLLPTLRWDVRPNHKEYCEHQYLIRLDESKWENCFQFFFYIDESMPEHWQRIGPFNNMECIRNSKNAGSRNYYGWSPDWNLKNMLTWHFWRSKSS